MNDVLRFHDMADASDANEAGFAINASTGCDYKYGYSFHYEYHDQLYLPPVCGDWQLFDSLAPPSPYAASVPDSLPGSPPCLVAESPVLNGSSPLMPSLDVPTPASSIHGSPSPSPQALSSGRDYPVCCLHPGCEAKPFKRRADLDRHYKHRHAPPSLKDAYHCDYPRCGRRRDPFHRRDHFRDHLRDFHREDIEKRGVHVQEDWFQGRNTAQSWWRCTKCLRRVSIGRCGFECPTCKTACQAKRKEARGK